MRILSSIFGVALCLSLTLGTVNAQDVKTATPKAKTEKSVEKVKPECTKGDTCKKKCDHKKAEEPKAKPELKKEVKKEVKK